MEQASSTFYLDCFQVRPVSRGPSDQRGDRHHGLPSGSMKRPSVSHAPWRQSRRTKDQCALDAQARQPEHDSPTEPPANLLPVDVKASALVFSRASTYI